MHTSKSPSDNAQSPQAGQLRSFAATIHTGPVITAQRKLSEQILASPRMMA